MRGSYSKSFLYSLLLHGAIFLALIFELVFYKPSQETAEIAKAPKPETIKAVSVNQQELTREMNEIVNARRLQQKKRAAEEERYQQTLKELKESTQDRQAALRKLKNEQASLERSKKRAIAKKQRELQSAAKQQQEMAEKLKVTQKRLAAEKSRLNKLKKALKKKKEEDAREKALALKKAEEQRQAALAEKQRDALIQSEVSKYKSLILAAISQNWIVPSRANLNLSCRFQVSLASNGEVQSVNLIKSSGDPSLDRSARLAIYQGSPLPVPSDPEIFKLFKVLNLTVTPKDLQKMA
jgi:colicin import membrane protein